MKRGFVQLFVAFASVYLRYSILQMELLCGKLPFVCDYWQAGERHEGYRYIQYRYL